MKPILMVLPAMLATLALASAGCDGLDEGLDEADDARHDSPRSARPFGLDPDGGEADLVFKAGVLGFYETYLGANELDARSYMTAMSLGKADPKGLTADDATTIVFRVTAPSGATKTVQPVQLVADVEDEAGALEYLLVSGFNLVSKESTAPGCEHSPTHEGCYRLMITTKANLAASAASEAPVSDFPFVVYAGGPEPTFETQVKL
jgi:hypothetical protein